MAGVGFVNINGGVYRGRGQSVSLR
jgi:hypothetical protein